MNNSPPIPSPPELAMKYLVYQVGCIECGVSSYPIKVCKTLMEACQVRDSHPSTWDSEGGDGYVTIINLKACKTVSGNDG
jgi:hypothetical protein